MTVQELCGVLSDFPGEMTVSARLDQKIRVLDFTGDAVIGQVCEYFDIQAVQAGEEFSVGTGFLPIAVLEIGNEDGTPERE